MNGVGFIKKMSQIIGLDMITIGQILKEVPCQVRRRRMGFQDVCYSGVWDGDIPKSPERYKSCHYGLSGASGQSS